MKLSSIFLTSSLAFTSVFAHPYHQHAEGVEAPRLEERQSGYTAVTGVQGNTYPRLEVRQMLWNKPNQWTLLILGMQKFQQMAQNDKLGYYQIAGIHGVPRVNWDNVGQCSSCGGTDGYCTHDSVLFPAWHRAYLALFEQQFMVAVNQVAASYPASQRPAMQGAASTMRFPYWDWAAHPQPGYPTLPNVMTEKMITVNGPNGQVTIVNPLFRHDFTDPSQMVYTPFINWQVTLRYPNSNANTASSVEQSATNAFENIRPSLQDQVYSLFTNCQDYLHFSNDDAGSSSTGCSNSLEGIHNTIHTTLGGPGSSSASAGHMTYLSTAGFDPGFWLHHANVDRLFAMWQAINPDSYGASQNAPHATWTIPSGQNQNADSPLTPFHKDTAGNFWTTNQVRDTKTFHYTYPEFANSDGSAGAIRNYVNKLYGPSATATAGSSKRTEMPAPYDAGNGTATGSAAYPTTTGTLLNNTSPLHASNGSAYQYVCNLETPRYSLNGSYSVFVFLRDPTSEEPTSWSFDKNLIGPYGILAQPDMLMRNITVAGSIPLTRKLADEVARGTLENLSHEKVEPYLKQHLRWRVAGPQGQSIIPDTIPGFKINVYGTTTEQCNYDELPKSSGYTHLQGATSGEIFHVPKHERSEHTANIKSIGASACLSSY